MKDILPKQQDKMINIPNGVDYKYLYEKGMQYDFDEKENIILSVTRVGSEEKNTEMLIEAFTSIENIENLGWKLKIVGPIEEEFKDYIDNYFENNPTMKDIVEFTGAIQNREELFNEYKKAKIFSLTSNFESFGIAFIEAASFGDVIVSTDVGIAKELTCEGNGVLVDIEDVNALKKELKKYMLNDNLKSYSEITYKIAKKNFDWDTIINKLNDNISKFFK